MNNTIRDFHPATRGDEPPLKKAVIEIRCCSDCPHFHHDWHRGNMCCKTQDTLRFDPDEGIAGNCPL